MLLFINAKNKKEDPGNRLCVRPPEAISIQLLLLFIGYIEERCLSVIDNFNTTLVIVYETWNHGFMRSVRPFRQISDKLPASQGALRLSMFHFPGWIYHI